MVEIIVVYYLHTSLQFYTIFVYNTPGTSKLKLKLKSLYSLKVINTVRGTT